MEATLEKVRALMRDIRTPQHYDKVFKDECVFTFDTPFSENGLSVNLKSWLGVGTDSIWLDLQRNGGGGGLYLLQQFKRVPKEAPAGDAAAAEPTKLAIGVEGGFMVDDKWDVQKVYSLLVVDASGDRTTVPLPNEELPTIVSQACDAIIKHMGATSMDETNRWQADAELFDSKYAKDLKQLPATKKISPNPADWKCEKYGATENLWLNLSDGFIGGGRKQGMNQGGSNGAIEHFEEELAKGNSYPLCVKLGTITPQGADVNCYAKDEDCMVKDPLLAQHLAHWGIDVMKMEKTAKTLAEMEVDVNKNYDWSRICESGGEPLVRLRGPGLVGLKNLGNSCYMNSSVQLLMGLQESKARYADADFAIRSKGPAEVSGDIVSQVAKLANGLMGERYAPPLKEGDDEDDPKLIVAPQMFRTLIGKGHSEFSSNRQQDAGEFLSYFLEQLARQERTALGSRLEAGKPLVNLFEFAVEGRLEQQTDSKGVLYSRQKQNMLMLPIKLEDADNLAEVTAFKSAQSSVNEKDPKKPKIEGEPEEPKPVIQLRSALDRWSAPEDGIEFRGAKATKTTRLATMPRYVMMQVQRYSVNEKWMTVKFDCKVPMPETVNLEHLRGKGLQPGETELKDEGPAPAATAAATAPAGPEPDEMVVAQLLSMGIAENGAKRAALAVQNAGADAAAGWYFEHMEDADINDPLPAPGAVAAGAASGGAPAADPGMVAELCSFGFAKGHVEAALKACGNSSERAADWLFSHADDLDGAVAALGGSDAGTGGGGAGAEDYEDGVGEYELIGFISHIGRNPGHGHYVCHARRGPGGKWVIFDDQKVALSESPPLDLGYIYLYRRKDAA